MTMGRCPFCNAEPIGMRVAEGEVKYACDTVVVYDDNGDVSESLRANSCSKATVPKPKMKPTKPNATLYLPMNVDTFVRIGKAFPKGTLLRNEPDDRSVIHVYFVDGEVPDDGV